jgi:hypothetical protein
MRILLVGPGFALPGGIQYVGHLLAEGLTSLYGAELRLEVASFLDGPDSCLAVPVDIWSGCRGNRVRFVRRLRSHLRRAPDLIVVNHVHQLPYVSLAATGLRTKQLAVVLHGIEAWRPLSSLRRMGLGRVSRLVFVSGFTQRRALEATPELAYVPGVVCHHGLLPEREPATPESGTGSGGGQPFVLMIGRMSSEEQYKGHCPGAAA